jgi:hypothetical protein
VAGPVVVLFDALRARLTAAAGDDDDSADAARAHVAQVADSIVAAHRNGDYIQVVLLVGLFVADACTPEVRTGC